MENMFEVEQEMQAFEEAMWAHYQAEEDLTELEESIEAGRQMVNDEVGYQYYRL